MDDGTYAYETVSVVLPFVGHTSGLHGNAAGKKTDIVAQTTWNWRDKNIELWGGFYYPDVYILIRRLAQCGLIEDLNILHVYLEQ